MRRSPFFLMFVLVILVVIFAYGRLRAAGIPTVGEMLVGGLNAHRVACVVHTPHPIALKNTA